MELSPILWVQLKRFFLSIQYLIGKLLLSKFGISAELTFCVGPITYTYNNYHNGRKYLCNFQIIFEHFKLRTKWIHMFVDRTNHSLLSFSHQTNEKSV